MIIPETFGQATLLFTGAAVPSGAAVTFGFFNFPEDDAATIANSIYGAVVATDLLDRFTSTLVLSEVLVKLGPNETGPQASATGSEAGDSSGDSVPNASVLVTKNTALGGRKQKGRMFFPGIIEADVANGGTIVGAAQTALQALFDDFLDTLSAATYPMYLLHSDEDTPPTPVTSLTVASRLATQRRRLRR